MANPKTILFINPPSGLYRRDDRCQSRVEDPMINVIFPPIELAEYAAVARDVGWLASIRDYPAQKSTWDDCQNEIAAMRPAALLINTTSATAREDLKTAQMLKAVRPDALTIARGEYLHYDADKILREETALDLIVWGEIEATLPRILHLAHEGADSETLSSIPGVAFAHSDGEGVQVFISKSRPIASDLDSLPLAARDLLDNSLYRSPETGAPLSVIHANRGCASRCVFCPAGALSNYTVRFRAPSRIVKELKECVERYGIHEFLFHGDTFTMKKTWVAELCQRIIESGLDIRWGCNSRVDTFDYERAALMKRAGCWVVAFGVESGNQTMLDKMRKGARLEKAVEAVRAARRAGLRVHTFYIIGLPWETPQTLADTLAFARKLDADFFDFNIAYPLPGTELWEIAQKDQLFEDPELAESSYAKAGLKTYAMSAAELTAWRRKALLKLYLRPLYILRTLWRARSPKVFKHYLHAAQRRLRSLLKSK
ncbi:MAG: radical SAM protein [Candidatus Sumerlaeota bacterium]|nr:radical SAM protein [Candidatus Sumerlaeota bacterium]